MENEKLLGSSLDLIIFITAILLMFSVFSSSIEVSIARANENTLFYESSLYYIVHARTSAEDVDDVLTFELPINISEPLVRQEVRIREVAGDFEVLQEGEHVILALPLNKTGGAEGFALIEINIAYNWTKPKVSGSWLQPTIPAPDDYAPRSLIPKELIKKYVREPDEAIRSIENEVDEYLRRHKVDMDNVVEVAYWIAKYIMENFKYKPSGKPRPLGEVVVTRAGDCDDLSELFINFMWRYGIPAQLERVAVVLVGEKNEYRFDGSRVIYLNVGYHAYAIVYMPGWGWVSVDITFNNEDNPFYGSRYATLGNVIVFDRVMERNIALYEEFESFMKKYNTLIEEIYYESEEQAIDKWRELLGLPKIEEPEVVELNIAPEENVTLIPMGGVIPEVSEEGENQVEILVKETRLKEVYIISFVIFLGLTALLVYYIMRRLRRLERMVISSLKELEKEVNAIRKSRSSLEGQG